MHCVYDSEACQAGADTARDPRRHRASLTPSDQWFAWCSCCNTLPRSIKWQYPVPVELLLQAAPRPNLDGRTLPGVDLSTLKVLPPRVLTRVITKHLLISKAACLQQKSRCLAGSHWQIPFIWHDPRFECLTTNEHWLKRENLGGMPYFATTNGLLWRFVYRSRFKHDATLLSTTPLTICCLTLMHIVWLRSTGLVAEMGTIHARSTRITNYTLCKERYASARC